MKKKCTNSRCRKTFKVMTGPEGAVCPYCGKKYPRIPAYDERILPYVSEHGSKHRRKFILNSLGNRKALVMKSYLGFFGLSLHETVELSRNLPCVIGQGTYQELRTLKEWLEGMGASCSIK